MSLVVDGLRSDVVSVGELGDDAVAEVAERIADPAGPFRAGPHPRPAVRGRRRAVGRAARGAGRDPGRPATTCDLAYVEDERGPRLRGRRRPVGPHHPAPDRGPQGQGRGGRGRRGRLGEHLHRAHARTGHIDRTGAEPGAAGTACAGTARPEGSETWRRHSRHPGPCGSRVENEVGLVAITRARDGDDGRLARARHAGGRGARRARRGRVPAGPGAVTSSP